jgi:Uma2 family endonuclease
MVATKRIPDTNVLYPIRDGEPVAETFDHLYAIWVTLEVLRQYLEGQQATVLGNQFLYYAQGFPRLRVAADVMVIFGVDPGGRDSYKIWDEGQVPSVIFEITSKGTQQEDQIFKKTLYAQLGVTEYWLFDPKGEWLESPLLGFRLEDETYQPILNLQSHVLQLRLQVEGKLIGFYQLDTGQKLLVPSELREKLQEALAQQDTLEQQVMQYQQQAERLAAQLRALGVDPDL